MHPFLASAMLMICLACFTSCSSIKEEVTRGDLATFKVLGGISAVLLLFLLVSLIIS